MGYVGFRWTPDNRDQRRMARSLVERLQGDWRTLMDWRGLILLHRGGAPIEVLPHDTGFVFGERFGRPAPDPSPPCEDPVDFTPVWIEERWGAYIAVLIDRGFDLVRVLRDPSGARPCFLSEIGAVRVFFDDAQDFIALAPDVAPDLRFVRSFLRYPGYLGRHTGLEGVEELAPGECAVYSREGSHIETRWTPHRYSISTQRLDFRDGVRALRAAAETCVHAYAEKHQSIALRLSGGFDSSVMLGLLHWSGGAEIACVNEFWEGAPEGDEREQARAVAAAHSAKLHELRIDPCCVDYARCLAAPLTVKPTLALLALGNPDVGAFYQSLGCSVIASGQGGDHLFHRSRTPWIAADALCDGAPIKDILKIAIDTARLTRKSVWEVFAAMAIAATGIKVQFERLSSVMGVLIDDQEGAKAASGHTWLADLQKSSPARALRVRQLVHALGYFDEATISPAMNTQPWLLSQPIVETCLRIAPYVMTEGGRERALARAAFADLIPETVLQRVSKGETTRFFATVLAANQDWIRSLLPEGRLVELGVVDKSAMQLALTGAWVQDGVAADGLYGLIAAECWLRNLEAARTAATASSSV